MQLLLFGVSNSNVNDSYTYNVKLLLVFPGVGFQLNRTKIILENIDIIKKSSVEIKCVMFYYSMPSNDVRNIIESLCSMEEYVHGNFGEYVKSLSPSIVNFGGFTHVMLLLDDVELGSKFEFITMFDAMFRNDLSVVSPAILGAHQGAVTPRSSFSKKYHHGLRYKVGHFVDVIEIFATIFTLKAWKCFWDLVDPKINSSGWGYDLYLSDYCKNKFNIQNFSLGVIDSVECTHHAKLGRVLSSTDYLCTLPSCSHPSVQKTFLSEFMHIYRNISLKEGDRHRIGLPLS